MLQRLTFHKKSSIKLIWKPQNLGKPIHIQLFDFHFAQTGTENKQAESRKMTIPNAYSTSYNEASKHGS